MAWEVSVRLSRYAVAGQREYGLIERVPYEHPLCRRLQLGQLSVSEAWRLNPSNRAAVSVTCRLSIGYEQNKLLQDLLYAWRLLAPHASDPNAEIVIRPARYPREQVAQAFQLLVRARQARLMSKQPIRFRQEGWRVRPIAHVQTRSYFTGRWLELFALIGAWLVHRVRCRELPEPLGRVVINGAGGEAACEFDVVVPMPNGKFVFVEAKTGAAPGAGGKLAEAASRWGVGRRYAVLLKPSGEPQIYDNYIAMGPRHYIGYLKMLVSRTSSQ